MVSVGLTKPAVLAGLGLALAALSACATAPAPTAIVSPVESAPLALEPEDHLAGAAHVANARAHLQCVPYARQLSGVEIYGDAVTWWRQAEGRYPRSSTPAPGAVFVIKGYRNPRRGHVAVVSEIVSDRLILVDHANWLNGGEISVSVPVLDVSPNNDWSAVRVWHIPGAHWGGRIYSGEGFIHPFTLRGLMS